MDYHDKETQAFRDERDFLRELKSLTETDAEWDKVQIDQIRFVTIDEVAGRLEACEELGVYADTQQNSKLYMEVPGKGLLAVGNSALVTICQRAKISGAALWKLSNEFLVQLLNECFALFKDKATIYVSMKKIRAAHSEHYVRLDMVDIFEKSTEVLKDSLEQVKWKSGYIDHSCAIAEYEIGDEGLLGEYKRLFKTEDIKATLKVVSSNTGDSGANISYGLETGNLHILLSNTLKMNHKGNCSMDQFIENLEKTFSQFRAAYKNFHAMKKIIIMHPNTALYEAMLKQHISKKLVAETVELRKATCGDKYSDALSLYLDACEVIGIAKRNGMSDYDLHDLSEKVSRLVCADWTRYDYASKEELLAA